MAASHPSLARRIAARSAMLAALLAIGGVARADCFDWSDAGLLMEQGSWTGSPAGRIRWRTGRAASSGGHLATAVELRWTDRDGRDRRQTLFAEIQDGRPFLDWRRGALLLRVTYCVPGRRCRDVVLPYAWNARERQFSGASPAARAALSHACAASESEEPR
ncbi:hypothetical protein [Muricoccus radiodurans]|uniref:hypothetical protein n=1 Tax=Muricoccus radiodurans TaxID=2231721 RepID=UPI003CED789B